MQIYIRRKSDFGCYNIISRVLSTLRSRVILYRVVVVFLFFLLPNSNNSGGGTFNNLMSDKVLDTKPGRHAPRPRLITSGGYHSAVFFRVWPLPR